MSTETTAGGLSDVPLVRSFRIQLRVLGALLLREIITRYGRQNFGFLWLFGEPMLFTLGVTAFWTATKVGGHGSVNFVVAFGITGYSSVLLWRNCATRASMAILPNVGLLYHRNVRVLDLFISRILLEIAGATISFVLLSALFISIGWMHPPENLLQIMGAWALLAWFGTALAFIVGAASAYNEITERLWHTSAYLLFPLSGAVFMVDWLPRSLQKAVLYLPMVNGVEMLRAGYYGNAVRTHYDVPYVVAICMAMTLFGLFLVRDAARHVEVA